MRFKVSSMTIMAISMAFACGLPFSSHATQATSTPTKISTKKFIKTSSTVASKKISTKSVPKTKKKTTVVSKANLVAPTKATTLKDKAVSNSEPAKAQETSTSTTTHTTLASPVTTSKVSISSDTHESEKTATKVAGSFGGTRSTNLIDHKDGSRGDAMDYELNLSYKLNKDYRLSTRTGYSQDLKDSETHDFNDTSVTMSKSAAELGSYVLASPNTTIILPTSKRSRILQNLQAGLRIGTSFSLNPIVNPNLSLGISISGGQNFHQYETDINGRVLTKYSFTQSLSLGYAFGDLSLSTVFIHKNGWSYQNSLSEGFEHAQELGYKINDTFSTTLGHTNSGSALKANGEDSNFALINENDSIVYGGLTLTF